MKARLSSILMIINLKTIIVTFLAVLSTFLCIKYKITANFPLTLISTAVIFPIVFSISGAYKRREAALNEYAVMKGNGKAIYFATRDWVETPNEKSLERIRQFLGDLLRSSDELFAGDRAKFRDREMRVYESFSTLSTFIKTDLRDAGMAGGEVSRCNQFLSKMLVSFERIKHIYQYRTPRTLHTFSDFFITILPPLYGPYFAYKAAEFPGALAYVTPILFSLILVSLDNIQSHLENPFDKIGEDDISFNVDRFVDRLQ
jgi:hypothetical protein